MYTYMLDSSGYLYCVNIDNNITNITRLDKINIKFKEIAHHDAKRLIMLDFSGQLYMMNRHNSNQVALNMLIFDTEIINFISCIDCIVLIDINYDAHVYSFDDSNTYIKKIGHVESVFKTYMGCNVTLYIVDNKIYCLGVDNEFLEIKCWKNFNKNNDNDTIYVYECKNKCINHNAHSNTSPINIFSKYNIGITKLIISAIPLVEKIKNDDKWIYTINNNLVISSNINLLYRIRTFDDTHDAIYCDVDGNKYNIIDGAIIKNIELNNYYVELPPKFLKNANNIGCQS